MDLVSRWLAYAFLTTAMLGIGLQVDKDDIHSTLSKRSLLVRSLLANFVLVPALGILVVRLFPMSADVATAFILLAVAPGGLSALQFTKQAKGVGLYAGALTFVLSLLSVLVTPAVAEFVLGSSLSLPYGRMIGFLVLFLALPLGVGIAGHRAYPRQAEKLARVASVVAAATFVAFVLYLMRRRSAAIGELGRPVVVAMLFFIVGSMAIGWALGGPAIETRRVLATATSMRNAAICLIIASRGFAGSDVEVAVVAFSALMVPPNMLFTVYALIQGRRKSKALAKTAAAAHGV